MSESVPSLVFDKSETDLLGRTADALSAWMGKPVLGEIVSARETGFEWALFAIPLQPGQSADDMTVVQVGGQHARLVGNRGGLPATADTYQCEFLWAVQLSDVPGVRFIKVDSQGEEIAWTDNLNEILPFDLTEPPPPDD
ncbi:MAG TPA: hypothetical protein VK104_08185 [Burkholderiaceae bacterium]|nr:hypothetical protein [Burkholderiaceae bacterium]